MVADKKKISDELDHQTAKDGDHRPIYEPPQVLELGELVRASNQPGANCPGGGQDAVSCGGGGGPGDIGTCPGGMTPVAS